MKHPTEADIAEMRARGYDCSTIARAELQLERGIAAMDVVRAIEAAFDGVTLGRGVGLRQGQGLDEHEDDGTCAAYRERDEKPIGGASRPKRS